MPHSAVVIKKGNPPVPLFDQSCSINYNGSNANRITGGSNRSWGMANEFSVMYWFMPRAFNGSDNLLLLGTVGSAANLITIQRQVSATKWNVGLYNSGGSQFKSYTWDDGAGEIEEFQWYQLWLTWDGTDLDVYTNSVNRTASATKGIDNAGTMTNTSRAFILGANLPGTTQFPLDGNTHQVAFFNKKLTDAEIVETYNGGNGTAFNLAFNQGNYSSKANLLSWYQMAKDTSNPQSSYYLDFGNVNSFNLNGIQGTHEKEGASPTGILVENQTFLTGSADYLQSAEAVTGLGTDWSISTWIRRATAGGTNNRIFMMANSSQVANRRMLLVNTSNGIQLDLRGPSGSSSASLVKSWQILDMDTAGSSVEWDHLVFTYTDGGGGDDALRVYVNGEDISFKTSGSGIGDPRISKVNDGQPNQTDTAQNITLGAATDGSGTDEWSGRMYNWAAWDSVLTAAEVTSLYNGGDGSLVDYRFATGDYASTADLLFYWRFANTGNRTENLGSDVTHDLNAENDPGSTFLADAPVGRL